MKNKVFVIPWCPHTNRLLVLQSNKKKWSFPGGKIQFSETPMFTIMREMKESTGIYMTNVNHYKELTDINYKIYVFQSRLYSSETSIVLNKKYNKFIWVTILELKYLHKNRQTQKIWESGL
jgi:8-oxo-dGTP pyrophosphatase MutT (NUDIX family)